MSQISWSDAITIVIGPALVVGSLVGVIGGFGLSLASIVSDLIAGERFSSEMITGTIVFIGLGAVLGWIFAWPPCLIFGAIMLRWSIRYEACQKSTVWAVAGMFAGLATSSFIGLIFGDFVWIRTTLLTVPLGALGALVCRRMLKPKIFDISTQ